MKTLIAALAAVTAVTAVAAPAIATAQPYDRYEHARHDRGAYNLNQRQDELNRRIAWGVRTGALTRGEAADLRDQARNIARIEARYRVNGLNSWERADLDRRFDRLDTRIGRQTHDREYGYGYGHRR
ncbi:MAG: hypothetical protein JHD15_04080 [Phenylobacterium sp.]|jgi:hypothetical protein|uniref:hypothetical protein n=1 Tax=unclassified Phenylobacterium TaxID=2640670 RepID=UPI0008CF516D|nr:MULTISPECIES: hypothetical protein [unclassified Phenylobacterium]MBJ7409529.1 hypothetical protein [Phenylobacterium sp.]OHB26951.1 MAG: hypothetical protein A2790_13935 [Phenylobacterium sp. RIFCSPHIGHO2_01_FULL_69_31]